MIDTTKCPSKWGNFIGDMPMVGVVDPTGFDLELGLESVLSE